MFNNGSGQQSQNAQMNTPPPLSLKTQALIIAGCLLLSGLFTSYNQVETAQQGVVTRFGAFSHILDEGPHFVLPFYIDRVYKVPVTRIHELQFGFRKDSKYGITKSQARRESLMLTGDLNVAVVEWNLQYKISDPKNFYFTPKMWRKH